MKIYEFSYTLGFTDNLTSGNVCVIAENLEEVFRKLYLEIQENEKKEGRKIDESKIRLLDFFLLNIEKKVPKANDNSLPLISNSE